MIFVVNQHITTESKFNAAKRILTSGELVEDFEYDGYYEARFVAPNGEEGCFERDDEDGVSKISTFRSWGKS